MGSVIANTVIILILLAALTGACLYIHKEKKKGRHCIGCPYAAACPKRNIVSPGHICDSK
ncbi:MAG: hypothetical protein K6G22_09410 [Lachnospiraceae bacterium]|nr:hypothetical protein [Lachnospiraceae bacterium]